MHFCRSVRINTPLMLALWHKNGPRRTHIEKQRKGTVEKLYGHA